MENSPAPCARKGGLEIPETQSVEQPVRSAPKRRGTPKETRRLGELARRVSLHRAGRDCASPNPEIRMAIPSPEVRRSRRVSRGLKSANAARL